jgi:SAM-dependent methyltransferase
MVAMDRMERERLFHDRQARDRATWFTLQPSALLVDENAFLDHETWIRPAFRQLGNLKQARVLDYGCGHGMAGVVLARLGAEVTAFDLSGGYVREARQRARINDVSMNYVQANGEYLPFPDHSFDRVWGNAVLHHLRLPIAGRELRRVMRPGGIAVFCEPWGENPILNFARNRLPYRGKERTHDEEPLRRWQVDELRDVFPDLEIRGYQFFSMVRRVLSSPRLNAGLERCDRIVLSRVPALERYCRYVVLTLRVPSKSA